MVKPRRARFVALTDLLARNRPDVDVKSIAAGRVLVNGSVVANPRARVRADAAVRVLPVRRAKGEVKLAHCIESLAVPIAGRVAVDVGASAGGFSTALLERGAQRVYAVDVGVGQLAGRLRCDARVVNLEGHNVADLGRTIVPDVIELITIDLSYLAVADAVPQLEALDIHDGADLVALVKPTFELHRARLAASDTELAEAVARASCGVSETGWRVVGVCPAPTTGRRRAREVFIHATRADGGDGRSSARA